jgi:hypothetical protein
VTIFQLGEVIDRREVLHGSPWLVTSASLEHRRPWRATSVLQLYRAGDAYSVWGFYEAGVFTGWYVNFEAPIRR